MTWAHVEGEVNTCGLAKLIRAVAEGLWSTDTAGSQQLARAVFVTIRVERIHRT